MHNKGWRIHKMGLGPSRVFEELLLDHAAAVALLSDISSKPLAKIGDEFVCSSQVLPVIFCPQKANRTRKTMLRENRIGRIQENLVVCVMPSFWVLSCNQASYSSFESAETNVTGRLKMIDLDEYLPQFLPEDEWDTSPPKWPTNQQPSGDWDSLDNQRQCKFGPQLL
jgi:hypothetical protein